jgi:hypothetical protein
MLTVGASSSLVCSGGMGQEAIAALHPGQGKSMQRPSLGENRCYDGNAYGFTTYGLGKAASKCKCCSVRWAGV